MKKNIWNGITVENTVELGHAVDGFLTRIGETENSYGESFAETARRLAKNGDTENADIMDMAETMWFEMAD